MKISSQNLTKIYSLAYKDLEIPIKVRKNRLSKSYKLTFNKKELCGLVSIPKYISFKDGFFFAKENIQWIGHQLDEFLPLIIIKDGAKINFLGKVKNIRFKKSDQDCVENLNNELIIFSKIENYNYILEKWMKLKIIEYSNIFIKKISIKLGVKISRIKVTSSYSYWGACNSKSEISINWRLLFCPEEVLEYIIAHELCHLIEFNHSNEFWRLVDTVTDNRDSAQVWLKKYNNYMHRIRFH